jgi:NAD dependent epimerase/dehydratase family enzyme
VRESGDQASLALGSRRVWPGVLLDHGFVFSQPHLEEALASALGKPVTLRRVRGG